LLNDSYLAEIIISGVFLLIYWGFQILLIVISSMKLLKGKQSLTRRFFSGLKLKVVWVACYFFHYYLIRVAVSILILLTPWVDSKVVFGIILAIQTAFTCLHVIKIYDKVSNYFLCIV